ncbi:armadillo-type protein [Gymnopilus junonius]|uniref:Armadillo-type protein n=1 Tax=Gymnopilus junonius TaxID=109634 RepID=A0A9P5NX03_GYMJU|nr:armadillo-type protein [Gymnopilus junonius]
MFKGILPPRRVPSADFTVITNLVEGQEKENLQQPQVPATTKSKHRSVSKGFGKKKSVSKKPKDIDMPDTPVSGEAFDKLLDDLQIPSTLRPKLYGMDASVKAAMIKSSQTMAIGPTTESPPGSPRSSSLRKAHSTDSMMSNPRHPTLASLSGDSPELVHPGFSQPPVSAHNSPYLSSPQRRPGHARGFSFHSSQFFSKSQVNLTAGSSSTVDLSHVPKSAKEKGLIAAKNLSPTKFCSILTSTSSTQLDIEDLKKLRLLLRNESATWSQEFLKLGGYSALLTRLNEILEVEWREEQHDDQVLHELLRCFKALSTSSIGCFALRSSCPTPFVRLVALLYSDKKPGEVATRQLIVELLLLLFDLYPPSSLPSTTNRPGFHSSFLSVGSGSGLRPRQPQAWESQTSLATSNLITLPAPHKSMFSLIRSLLLTPAPPPAEAPGAPVSPHEFIESLHVPRIYKTYLQELSDVCRDYFWVFCHPNNTIWVLSETNENSVEKPRAPGGMTGGVEFEAMAYFTTQLKLVNAIAKSAEVLSMSKDSELSAYRFHTDLFLSGFERIILISRKASTTYYPNLHLELARYIAYAARAGYELPYTVARLIGLPPSAHAKNPVPKNSAQGAGPQGSGGTSGASTSGRNTPRTPVTPSKRSSAILPPGGTSHGMGMGMRLPSPRKVESLKFDL